MHGKTRRGALVFDVADLIKDALILPWAFICAKEEQ
ncbi:CRISPR-associated endonuclease Cas1, subtype I-F/YPEST [Legionella gratiana]|uniref:CRISPR-associated endonuclease Cas1, subtype I-F/YPEST n=1 Tax=Legionella gratiana TaxID=45066 RepID=A0A378JDE9_9GAMM|nr:CRISPR-associated endonuclease Cas1, subtype I-F/YPEST [Legionella gratiana]